jgi:hypothetical protein
VATGLVFSRFSGIKKRVFARFFVPVLKQFQLLRRWLQRGRVVPPENFHHPKLFIRNAHNAHVALGRQVLFRSGYVYICILPAAAMAHVYAELKHLEAVLEHLLPEVARVFTVLLCFSGQVEEY